MPPNLYDLRFAFREGRYRYSTHALEQILARGIRVSEVEEAIGRDAPEILEDYPVDARGPSCLILGWADLARPLHLVIGYPGFDVITVYEPDPSQWRDYRQRV